MKRREGWAESERAAQRDGEKKAKRPLEDFFFFQRKGEEREKKKEEVRKGRTGRKKCP